MLNTIFYIYWKLSKVDGDSEPTSIQRFGILFQMSGLLYLLTWFGLVIIDQFLGRDYSNFLLNFFGDDKVTRRLITIPLLILPFLIIFYVFFRIKRKRMKIALAYFDGLESGERSKWNRKLRKLIMVLLVYSVISLTSSSWVPFFR